MQPVVLIRDDKYKEAYTHWKKSTRKKQALAIFKKIYEASFFGNGDKRCDIIRQPQYSMLVLRFSDDFFEDDLPFLMDHIQEVLLGSGYYNYMSDKKQVTLDGGTKQFVDRHYMKPALDTPLTADGQIDRLFGNVIVELYFEDSWPALLKLTCNYYNERGMQKEKGIDKLMEAFLL